jgi:hypothetical protein
VTAIPRIVSIAPLSNSAFLPKSGPFGRCFGLGFSAVKNIVHIIEKQGGVFVPGYKPNNQPVRPGPGMAPRAHFHANAAVGTDFAPIIKACIGIELPAQGTVVLFGVIITWDRLGGATGGTFFTDATKIFDLCN